ncbi:MAG: phage tail protein [Candidatus Methanoperedens sp.]|nr:phage tail protein [Candidatus Methanoperedens sp.]
MSFKFLVEINGITVAGFSEVTGLAFETETETIEEGGVNDYVYILPKRTKRQNLILKHGITDDVSLWEWYQKVMNGTVKNMRKTVTIYLQYVDEEGKERKWEFFRAYPVKWTGPEFRADSNSVAFETIELVHDSG